MSEQTEQTETTTTTTTKTQEQHFADLVAWCKARGLQPVIMAQGKRTGAMCPIDDFLPETHTAIFTVMPEARK